MAAAERLVTGPVASSGVMVTVQLQVGTAGRLSRPPLSAATPSRTGRCDSAGFVAGHGGRARGASYATVSPASTVTATSTGGPTEHARLSLSLIGSSLVRTAPCRGARPWVAEARTASAGRSPSAVTGRGNAGPRERKRSLSCQPSSVAQSRNSAASSALLQVQVDLGANLELSRRLRNPHNSKSQRDLEQTWS